MAFLDDHPRTQLGATLTAADIGREVSLAGWVQSRRDHGGCVFIDLRDRSGLVQVVFDPLAGPAALAAHARAGRLRGEWVLGVVGRVRGRGAHHNPKLASGEIEVEARLLDIFSEAKTPPFAVADDTEAGEEVRLRHRYVDLRRPRLQHNLMLRHRFCQLVRQQLDGRGFVEVETPFLVKSTPEGARDYVVPSRVQPGHFFALPQSPQLFKQLLMVAGFDRYYQIVRCFRDEDLRAERQPEFTQIDLEMSFCTAAQVQEVAEEMLALAWERLLSTPPPRPFPRLTYAESMRRFGTDAPDLRYGLELVDLGPSLVGCGFAPFAAAAAAAGGRVAGINLGAAGAWSRRELDALATEAESLGAKGLAWMRLREDGGWQSPVAKFLGPEHQAAIVELLGLAPGEVAIFCADVGGTVARVLGGLRRSIARQRGLGAAAPPHFVWITDFPLMEWDAASGRHVALHHPFTAPVPEDEALLASAPAQARAQAYDIVLNGTEIGGGSIRIHDPGVQAQVFAALGMSPEDQQGKFGFLLQALAHGAPPHGGLALGLDRILMAMCQTASIRDVIAFPKTQKQTDLMLEAPSRLGTGQLLELGLGRE